MGRGNHYVQLFILKQFNENQNFTQFRISTKQYNENISPNKTASAKNWLRNADREIIKDIEKKMKQVIEKLIDHDFKNKIEITEVERNTIVEYCYIQY